MTTPVLPTDHRLQPALEHPVVRTGSVRQLLLRRRQLRLGGPVRPSFISETRTLDPDMNRSFPIFRPLALAAAWLFPTTILHADPGDLAWARTSLSSANSSADTRALWVDGNDNTYAVGRFVGTVDFFGTTLTATSTSIPSGWAAKFAPDGAPLWVRKLATNNFTELHAVCQFGNGEILVGGSASGSFSVGAIGFTIPSASGQNTFLARLEPGDGKHALGASCGGKRN
jgi:hypothetical protein